MFELEEEDTCPSEVFNLALLVKLVQTSGTRSDLA